MQVHSLTGGGAYGTAETHVTTCLSQKRKEVKTVFAFFYLHVCLHIGYIFLHVNLN